MYGNRKSHRGPFADRPCNDIVRQCVQDNDCAAILRGLQGDQAMAGMLSCNANLLCREMISQISPIF